MSRTAIKKDEIEEEKSIALVQRKRVYQDNILQVAALAPLVLLLLLEAHCTSIILCCGVVHHCSYIAHVSTNL